MVSMMSLQRIESQGKSFIIAAANVKMTGFQEDINESIVGDCIEVPGIDQHRHDFQCKVHFIRKTRDERTDEFRDRIRSH